MLSRHVERQAIAAPRPLSAREELVLGEDYWEEDQQEVSYNPAVAAAGRPVLRRLAGETPSARKEFRRQEAARLGGMVGYREKPPMWSAGLRRQEASPFLSGQVTRGVVVRHVEYWTVIG